MSVFFWKGQISFKYSLDTFKYLGTDLIDKLKYI